MKLTTITNEFDIQAYQEAQEFFAGLQILQPDAKFADVYADTLEWLHAMTAEQRQRRQQWMEKNIRSYERNKIRSMIPRCRAPFPKPPFLADNISRSLPPIPGTNLEIGFIQYDPDPNDYIKQFPVPP